MKTNIKPPRRFTRRNYKEYLPPVLQGMTAVYYVHTKCGTYKCEGVITNQHRDNTVEFDNYAWPVSLADIKEFKRTDHYQYRIDGFLFKANIVLDDYKHNNKDNIMNEMIEWCYRELEHTF